MVHEPTTSYYIHIMPSERQICFYCLYVGGMKQEVEQVVIRWKHPAAPQSKGEKLRKRKYPVRVRSHT